MVIIFDRETIFVIVVMDMYIGFVHRGNDLAIAAQIFHVHKIL